MLPFSPSLILQHLDQFGHVVINMGHHASELFGGNVRASLIEFGVFFGAAYYGSYRVSDAVAIARGVGKDEVAF